MTGNAVASVEPGRRDFLKWAGAGTLLLTIAPLSVEATPADVRESIGKLIGDLQPGEGPFTIELPRIAENGAVVSVKVGVESPMTESDHVRAIHIFAEGNPRPDVASYYLGPHNGKAEIALRIRLMETQNIVFLAETSKGEAFVTRQNVKVTLGGCGG